MSLKLKIVSSRKLESSGIAGNMSTWSYSFRGTSDIISGFLIDFPLLTFINKGNASVEIFGNNL